MKKALLIIGLLLTVTIVNSYNYPNTDTGSKEWAYENKTLEIMYDSKKRPYKKLFIRNLELVWQLLI